MILFQISLFSPVDLADLQLKLVRFSQIVRVVGMGSPFFESTGALPPRRSLFGEFRPRLV